MEDTNARRNGTYLVIILDDNKVFFLCSDLSMLCSAVGLMPYPYRPYICQTIGELNDKLGWMMLHAPTFEDETGYFPDRNLENTFEGFNESLDNLRGKLGEERYAKMREMSDRMRAMFESDPESKTGGSKAGRQIIHEMGLMLRPKRAAPR